MASDWADSLGRQAVKLAFTVAAAAAFGGAFIRLAALSSTIPLPLGVRIAGLILCVPCFFLLVYSHFFEVPPLLSYGPADRERQVFSRGTYALVRHPGVLWLLLFHACAAAACASRLLALSIPFWNTANLLIAVLEDAVFFPRIFGSAYLDYRRKVPFVLPTPSSIRKCMATILKSR